MTGTLIFWAVVIAWLVVGFRRQPLYFKRAYDSQMKQFGSLGKERARKEAAWSSLGLALFWGWYEAGLWYRDTLIRHMTREEREKEEFEKAEKIVADYNAKKEREARDKFRKEGL